MPTVAVTTAAAGGLLHDVAVGIEVLVVVGAVVVAVTAVRLTVTGVRAYRRLRRRVAVTVAGVRRGEHPALAGGTRAAWWGAQRERRRMWRAVAAAEQAVGVAQRRGVTAGDLGSLVRQLAGAATAVDAGLVASAGSGRLDLDLQRQARELTAAADEVTATAGGALAADARVDTARVVAAVRVELEAVRHGWRAQSVASRRP